MVSAQQGQVVQISQPTQDPIHYVVSVAPAGGMGTPGERTSAVSDVQAMVWPGVAIRRVLPKARGMLWWLMMVGQISASSAIRSSCSARVGCRRWFQLIRFW